MNDAELRKLKVPELKELLKEAGKPVSGKKDDLIARLLEGEQLQEEETVESLPEAVPAPSVEVPEEQPTDDAGEAMETDPPVPTAAVEPEPAPLAPTPPVPVKEASPKPANGVHERDQVDEPVAKRARVEEVQIAPVEETTAPEVAGDVSDALVPAVEEQVEEEEPPEYNFEPEEEDSSRPTDMYLDTINRSALDFDFERLCSVTLSHNNIYACLTDGKFFQGRGKTSPAYAHSIAEDHHVYINLTTLKVYVLPDGYEVTDPSLDDIKYLLYPTFTPTLLTRIDRTTSPSYDLQLKPYYPGFIGLNNIKANSWMNSILQSLAHVIPLRDYFILTPSTSSPEATELVRRFSMFCRKVWNPKAFKGQVSPHELLQEASSRSLGRFKITEVGDPLEFLSWLLNTLHKDLGGTKKPRSSIIYSAFQGEVRVDDQQILTTGEYGGKPRFDLGRDIKSSLSPFLFLAIDLPPPPLFQDAVEKNIIPQVPISAVLAKYNGITTQEAKGVLRRYKMTKLPPFLILHIKRFTKNNFVEEKNPTIVNFPLRGVDMQDYVDPPPNISTYYDLVSNITHSSAAGTAREETTWKAQVHLRPPRDEKGRLEGGLTEDEEKWFQIQDLIVEEINSGMIALGESYIQIWERRTENQMHELVVDPPKVKSKKL
ncbi:U4/U6.U5 tri-snRNP-associated protein 2, partial [Phenoliferia sp. Uapishka_3]